MLTLAILNNHSRAMRGAAAVTLLNVLVASGFAIVGLVRPEAIVPAGAMPDTASHLFALYAAARTLPLAAAVVLAVATGSSGALLVLGSLAGVIQGADAIVGIMQGDIGKTAGPLVLAGLQAYAIYRLRQDLSSAK